MRYFLLLLSLNLLLSCSQPATTASFLTTLGKDTLGVEQFRMLPDRVEAEVLLRSPATVLMKQSLQLGPGGGISDFRSESFAASNPNGEPVEVFTIRREGDSLVVTRSRNGQEDRQAFAPGSGTLPWMDMVHWPYEVATRQMFQAGESSRDQDMFAGRGVARFEIRQLGPDSVSIRHPYRGTMHARTDASGGLVLYDATATTRKLIVRRGGPLDMESLAARFADKPVGELSGEGHTESEVHGARIELTFGQPARRGRALFGGIVPWNELWRTGANRATHLKTDRDLSMGDLEIPAGEYTLFTIPAPDGGTLIVNRETGQNGNNYDADQDLGRVPMEIRLGENSVERFTIEAVENGENGELLLKWGETVFAIPFAVRDAE